MMQVKVSARSAQALERIDAAALCVKEQGIASAQTDPHLSNSIIARQNFRTQTA
jgi:hypothetical protein